MLGSGRPRAAEDTPDPGDSVPDGMASVSTLDGESHVTAYYNDEDGDFYEPF